MGTRKCKHISAMATPSKGEAGKTGQWRTQRPQVDNSKCLAVKSNGAACFQCWLYCPECVIEHAVPIEVDYTYCKGCGICAEECPAGAIEMVDEFNPLTGDGDGAEDGGAGGEELAEPDACTEGP